VTFNALWQKKLTGTGSGETPAQRRLQVIAFVEKLRMRFNEQFSRGFVSSIAPRNSV
jgi:hypothetical protein